MGVRRPVGHLHPASAADDQPWIIQAPEHLHLGLRTEHPLLIGGQDQGLGPGHVLVLGSFGHSRLGNSHQNIFRAATVSRRGSERDELRL